MPLEKEETIITEIIENKHGEKLKVKAFLENGTLASIQLFWKDDSHKIIIPTNDVEDLLDRFKRLGFYKREETLVRTENITLSATKVDETSPLQLKTSTTMAKDEDINEIEDLEDFLEEYSEERQEIVSTPTQANFIETQTVSRSTDVDLESPMEVQKSSLANNKSDVSTENKLKKKKKDVEEDKSLTEDFLDEFFNVD